MVTKSGSRDFHGSGYWYGRRSDWNANSWTNKRVTPEIPEGQDRRATTAATPSAARSSSRVSTRTSKKLFFFFSQEYQRRAEPAGRARETRVPDARSSARATSRRASTASGNRSLIHARLHDRPALQRRRHARLLPGRRRAREDSGQPPVPARPRDPEHLPGRPTSRASAPASTSRARTPTSTPRREDLLRMDYQVTDKWRVTGRYMKTKEDIAPGVRHDLGGQRQRPAADVRRSSCTPARTTCCRRRACSTRRRRSK